MTLIPLGEARGYVVERCPPRSPVARPIADALGCVLAAPVVAQERVPPFAGSAMDGYAVRAQDVLRARADAPVRLRVVGTLAAGGASETEVGAATALRIMTGAPIPDGADAVVIVERTAPDGDDGVLIQEAVQPGQNVRLAGSDVDVGTEVVSLGTVLGPGHLGVLASVGVRRPLVVPRPRVGVISTGDELVDDDRPLEPGQIRESNRPMLLGMVRRAGFEAVDLGTVRDDERLIERALHEGAATCDALITSGGVSMGDFDIVKVVLGRVASMRWMQIAIRPAKPFAFGVLDGTPVFGLPGNPVSSMVSFALLARPGLRRMAGHRSLDLPGVPAVAAAGLERKADGKVHFVRVRCRWNGSGFSAEPVVGQGSHQLAASAGANGLAVLPDGLGVPAGDPVTVVLLDDPFAIA
ncbi:MAG: molybdenum cofactor synthesis domain [Acidimicrobiales bacterium]|nr:molybdenum cofactor synthesis domain [Acidimicrobiales bacterium]